MPATASSGRAEVGNVVHIFVAPKKGAPAQSLQKVDALPGRGLAGHHYADATFIELEHIEAFTRATSLALTPAMPRRNIVTRGVRLNDLCGKRFRVGGAIFEGLELAEPCKLFARRTHREALPFFAGKGGLRARIVHAGTVQVGDVVTLDSSRSEALETVTGIA